MNSIPDEFGRQWNVYSVVPRRPCESITKSNTKCTKEARFFSDQEYVCYQHLPLFVKRILRKQNEIEAKREDEARSVWLDSTESRIRGFYESLVDFRRIPPPEIIAYNLLHQLQGERCFMCWAMGREYRSYESALIEDHCHRTGMVRSLLCRSCNVIEGHARRRPWYVYRSFAPANGWFYRYYGFGQQWEYSDPDPLDRRITLEKLGLSSEDLTDDKITRAAQHYIDAVAKLPATIISDACNQEFDLLGRRVDRRANSETRNPWQAFYGAEIDNSVCSKSHTAEGEEQSN